MPRKQHDANQRNARRSTGPTSKSGKANASRNAIKHGLSGVLVLTPSEHKRWQDIRTNFRDLTDEAYIASADIDECATAQVLLERLMELRHQAFVDAIPKSNNDIVVKQLQNLVRHEIPLLLRRDRLLRILDVDEYANFDPMVDLKVD